MNNSTSTSFSTTSTSSFLEVNINSEKLSEFLKRIDQTIKDQNHRIEQLNVKFTDKGEELTELFEKMEATVKSEQDRLKNEITAETATQKYSIRKIEEKSKEDKEEVKDKIEQCNLLLAEYREKVDSIQNESTVMLEECKEFRLFRYKMNDLEKNFINQKEEVKSEIKEFIQQKDDEKIEEVSKETFFKLLEDDRVRTLLVNDITEELESEPYLSRKAIRTAKALELENTKANEKETLFYASVSDKLNQLEKKIAERNNNETIQNNKVLYPSTPSTRQRKLKERPSRNNFIKESIIEQYESKTASAISVITDTLTNIEKTFHKKIEELQEKLTEEADKRVVLNEKIGILNKKIEKEHNRIYELKCDIKKFSDRKVDDKMIDSFRLEVRQLELSFEDNLSKRVTKDTFEKEVHRIYEKFRIDSKAIGEKSDKTEVKKAIHFVEEKLREIIFLVAGSYDHSANGAIQKKQVTCLSCDKDIESKIQLFKDSMKDEKENVSDQKGSNSVRKTADSAMKSRCETARILRKIRVPSGITSTKTFERTGSIGMNMTSVYNSPAHYD